MFGIFPGADEIDFNAILFGFLTTLVSLIVTLLLGGDPSQAL